MKSSDTTVLVIGGSGFLGLQWVLQLLDAGYSVRTTVRALAKKGKVLQALQSAGANVSRLEFFEADLTSDKNWYTAVSGCRYVLHVASPFPADNPQDENELIVPARDGAQRVLKAAKEANVERVVMTSSFAAIGYSEPDKTHVFSEVDWTDENAPIPAYIKSKTVAEKAAWNFVRTQGNGLELSVINPVGIFGPVMGDNYSASVATVIKGIVDGKITESPDFTFGVVDVRDVADLHLKAMVHPDAAGERFLATSDGVMSFADVADLIRKERPQFASEINIQHKTEDSFYISMDNQKAKNWFDWKPIAKESAILASVDSLYGKA
ncbi:SDR family oxidoreductase [Flavobacterium selenitireducens]|uniref:SDR family oxidoreductase n=1 Tax=Flavobacterium selenitireducens TaxID=2722704 RepID=UPI00168ADAE3|nr:aldehyde reductase [Flavobacterium selenitireducens]MBD3581921.1 aldehyde reductase [Flavobacterium selenitireducens]